ncbi:MAG: acyltransferase family protein [Gallionella sp.]|nr:acyltransferase family protein [Gallionella sp.]
MGGFRFMLAAFVAYSHFEGAFLPFNLGTSAVIGFYFISGYLMSLSYERFRDKAAHPVRAFYIDRIIRLYPAYLLVFAASVLFYWLSPKLAGLRPINLLELLVIPNNYTKLFEHKMNLVIPPSWSLGAEFQFYLLLPLLLRASKQWRVALLYTFALLHLWTLTLPGALGDYSAACLKLSQRACEAKASDLLGYRYLFFVGVVFILGNIAHEIYEKKSLPEGILHSVIALYILGFFLLFPVGTMIANENVFAVLLGVMLFIPLSLHYLQQLRLGIRPTGMPVPSPQPSPASGGGGERIAARCFTLSETDKWLGKLAYPLFLSHFLGQWIADMAWGGAAHNRFFHTQAMLVSVGLALLVALFQEVIDRKRYAYRGFGRVTGK